MNNEKHFEKLSKYFKESDWGYTRFLGGAKHFGFHPLNKKVSEKEALLLMQDLIGDKLDLSTSKKVLDAGCGEGVVTIYLAKKFSCVIEGITILPFEIEKAKIIAEKSNVSDLVNFRLMDYSYMDFSEETFDSIFTMESLSHSTNIKRTLKEFFRVLKKGGKIALFEYTIADDEHFSKYEMDLLNKVINASVMDSLKDFRHDKFQGIIKSIGFSNVKTENITQNIEPSLNRLRRIASIPYFFTKFSGTQHKHPNRTAAVEFYKMGKKGLLRYNIFTAEKK
jgi:ubiquinone/menaquinone biosynthesis C-methylase UbiE